MQSSLKSTPLNTTNHGRKVTAQAVWPGGGGGHWDPVLWRQVLGYLGQAGQPH